MASTGTARGVCPGTNIMDPPERDTEAEARVLRRHKFSAPFAHPQDAHLGDLLDCLVFADGIDDEEPFERRALGMFGAIFETLSHLEGNEIPDGLLFALERQANVFVELGRRLAEVGPVTDDRDPTLDRAGNPIADDSDVARDARDDADEGGHQ